MIAPAGLAGVASAGMPGAPTGGMSAVHERISSIHDRFTKPTAFGAALSAALEHGGEGESDGAVAALSASGSPTIRDETGGAGSTVRTSGLPAWLDPDAPVLGGGASPPSGAPGASGVGGLSGLADGPDGLEWASRLNERGQQWAPAIAEAAAEAGVDARLFAALVEAESGYRQDVVSHAGAIGLAQLMPGTAEGLGVDPHDPMENLRGGARYLRAMLDRFGSADLALAAYNAGPNRVERVGGIPNIAETQAYVPRVLDRYEQLR